MRVWKWKGEVVCMMGMGVLLSPIDFILMIALYIYANKYRAEKCNTLLDCSVVNDDIQQAAV